MLDQDLTIALIFAPFIALFIFAMFKLFDHFKW